MIWPTNYWWLISTDNLSNLALCGLGLVPNSSGLGPSERGLDSPKNFSSSSYNLSLQVQNLATITSKRCYSTNSTNRTTDLCEVDNIDNNQSIKFDSLQQACEEIKFKFLGVSGVYKLTSKNNPSRFYIGSSTPEGGTTLRFVLIIYLEEWRNIIN